MEYLYILKQALMYVLVAFWFYQIVVSACSLVKLKDKPQQRVASCGIGQISRYRKKRPIPGR